MIFCVDVDYRSTEIVTAGVGIGDWPDPTPSLERIVRSNEPPAEYEPGKFYLREMPRLVAIVESLNEVGVVVIDGYVWLAKDRPGLGARLYDAIGRRCPIVGVAKTAFQANDAAISLQRGNSVKPLFVTAVGIDVDRAADGVRAMAGDHRLPSILKRVDRLARDA